MEPIKEIFLLWRKTNQQKHRNRLLREIWKVYHPKLQTYVRNFQHGRGDLDLVSDILIHAFECVESYNSSYAFSTWIYSLARHYLIDRIRKNSIPVDTRVEDYESTDHHSPESILMKETQKQLIRDSVSKLPSLDKELVFLHFYEEMKYKDMALVTGIPVGTIKFRMFEVRKILKEDLERSQIHES